MTIGNWSTSQGLGLEYCIRDVNPDCAEMLKYCGCHAGHHPFTQNTEKAPRDSENTMWTPTYPLKPRQ